MEELKRASRQSWWIGAAAIAFVVSALSAVQSVGYWILSAANGEPTRMMFVDHDGPAVTSALIGIVTLGIGLAALNTGRRVRSV